MSTPKHIIYVTFDGLMEALGQTQVLRLVERLNQDENLRFTIVSLEKRKDLAGDGTGILAKRLSAQGIGWEWSEYQHGVAGIARNISQMLSVAGQILESQGCDLLHARSYLAGIVCDTLKSAYGVPFLFDFRGYWIDERIEEKRWFTNPPAVFLGRKLERHLFARADAIISLASPAADDIASGRFGDLSKTPVEVIPTCVDEERFHLGYRRNPRPSELKDKKVIGWVGSANASYLVEESLALTKLLLDKDETAFFLALTGQTDLLRQKALAHGIPLGRMMIRSVPHEEMPQWMGWMDWGLLLLHTNVAKRGSMPTKLGEFLASGVRPIYCGCNEDVGRWVARAGTGQTVDEPDHEPINPFDLTSCSGLELMAGWARVQEHFSLESGKIRYAAIYQALLGRS